jgi:putative Mn2+ efflux pump MntP
LYSLTNYALVKPVNLSAAVLLLLVRFYLPGVLGDLSWLVINSQMDLISIVLIAVGLAMDCFAVSITSGITLKQVRVRDAAKIALFFGLFQAGMPTLGWLAGEGLADLVSGVDHWIALGLLSFIGGKMIYEAFKKEESEKEFNPLRLHVLLMLSIATSIDALAVGVSFAFLGVFILTPIIIIGTVTFLISLTGVFVGCRFGQIFKNKFKIVGGLVLIGIGIKVLIQDLFFSTPF